jgi:hypothetical protein
MKRFLCGVADFLIEFACTVADAAVWFFTFEWLEDIF